MKYILIFFLFLSTASMAQNQLYDIDIPAVDSSSIKLSDFKGQKIVVVSVKPDHLQEKLMDYINTVQSAHPTVKILIIPAEDLGGEKSLEALASAQKELSSKVTITAIASVKKESLEKQNTLMRWLTSTEGNKHFELEVKGEEQWFVISETGALYSVLEMGFPPELLDEVLKQQGVKDYSSLEEKLYEEEMSKQEKD